MKKHNITALKKEIKRLDDQMHLKQAELQDSYQALRAMDKLKMQTMTSELGHVLGDWLNPTAQAIKQSSVNACHQVEDSIKTKPFMALSISGVVGFALGWWLQR